jgi:hypothetical protein
MPPVVKARLLLLQFKTRILGPGFNLDKDENRLCIMQVRCFPSA